MEERCCSVCCDVKAKAAIGARPWRIPPNTLLRQALLACTLAQQSERRATNVVSSPLQTAVAALNSYVGMLNTSEVSCWSKSLKRQANEHLVNWLCDVQSCRDLLDDNIPIESASHPFILNIEKLGLPSGIGEAFSVENLCGCCEKLIRMFAKHERRCQTIATSLFKATVKSMKNLSKSEKLITIHTSSNKVDITQKTFPKQSTGIAFSDPSTKDDTVHTSALSLGTKRKRGRPKKLPPNFEAVLPKRKKSDMDCAKSVCPFCSKVYSIEHSFVHNCLAYKNSLRCVKCNVFSSTYIRFEKHLEFFHGEKRLLCCQVSNCNQRFVSKPAFKWHSHFHTIEEKNVQSVYAEDINVVCAASTGGKGDPLPDVCSVAAASKVGATDDFDGTDVSSVTVISNDVDHVSSMHGCTDPANILMSRSTVEKKQQTVSCIPRNPSNEENHLNWFDPSSKNANQCPSIKMNKSQSFICLYNESENGSMSYTLPDDRQLAQPMFFEAQSTNIASLNRHTSHAGGDRQNHTSSAEPASVFVEKQRNFSNLGPLDVHQRLRQKPPVPRSKFHDQQQFVPISLSDLSVNTKHITIPEYSPSITIDQALLNTVQSSVSETHHSSGNTLLQCNGCQHYFSDQPTLDVHRISQCEKNDQQLLSCQCCNSSFLSPLHLKKHILARCQSSNNKDLAQDTSEDSIEESDFAQHILMYHRVGEQRYQCPVCEQLFYIISDLVEHLNGHDSTETCSCYICSVNIKSKPSEVAPRDFITVESPSQIWTCAMCQVYFLTPEALEKHCTDANHNIVSLGASKPSSEQATNFQMTHLDTNYLIHQLIHHDKSLHIKLVDLKHEMISHDANNPIPLSDGNRQIVVHDTNPSISSYDIASTLAESCPQSVVKVSAGLSSRSGNNVVAIGSQFSSQATHSTNTKQQILQSFSDTSGSSSFQVGRLMQSSDIADTIPAVVDTIPTSSTPGFAGRAGHFSGESLLSVDARPVAHPKVAETESCNTSQSLFNNSQSSCCQGCGVVTQDPTSLSSHVRSCPLLQQKEEAPFVEDHFISSTENLSVIKALESSSGNALTSIDHLIGAVDDMDYFT